MENTATNRQLFMIMVLVMIPGSSTNVAKIMTQSAGEGGWFTLLLAAAGFAALAYSISRLNNLFPGKMVFDYSSQLIGKFGAYLLGIFIALYFLAVVVTNDILLGNLLQTNFLPESPTWATMLASIPVMGFVANKGITNTARLIEIYGTIFFLMTIATHIVMLFQGDINHILPVFVPKETGRYIAALKDTVFPYLGFEVLLVIPFTNKNGKKANRYAIGAIVFAGLLFILDWFSDIMMIGENEILNYNFPLISAIRQVTLPQLKLFARIDMIYLTVGFLGVIGGLSFLYLGAVDLICRMNPKMKRMYAVILVGAAVFLADLNLKNINGIYDILRNVLTYGGLAVCGAIPLLLLAIAKVKRHGQKTAG